LVRSLFTAHISDVPFPLPDHAPVHDPDSPGFAELRFDLGHDRLNSLEVLGVAGKGAVRQGKTLPGHDQRHDDLLAVAAMIARISPARQFVLGRQPFEVRAGEVVEHQPVVELERIELSLPPFVFYAKLERSGYRGLAAIGGELEALSQRPESGEPFVDLPGAGLLFGVGWVSNLTAEVGFRII
jgi:hypothetical protein